MMPLYILKTDITKIEADAIVNIKTSMNFDLKYGTIIDRIVANNVKADESKKIKQYIDKRIKYYRFAITKAPGLKANKIMHIVNIGSNTHTTLGTEHLKNIYKRIICAATQYKLKSIAIPLIYYNNNTFSKEIAVKVVAEELTRLANIFKLTVYLIPYDNEVYYLLDNIFLDVRTYIEENYTTVSESVTYYQTSSESRTVTRKLPVRIDNSEHKRELNEIVRSVDKSFGEALVELIDKKGLTDPEVYHKAHMDKRTFHKIKKPEYHPSKKNALALGIALELNVEDLKNFIARAGYALSKSDRRDIIVEYCVHKGQFDISEINTILYFFGEPLIY